MEAELNMARRIQLRRDTAAAWTAANPVLAQGEIGIDLTNNKLKIGNGTAAWNSLAYFDDKETVLSNYAGHIVPSADNTYDLGAPDKQWRDIFVSNGSVYIGDIKLSNDNGTLKVQQVTDAGLETETPVPNAPGVVTTDRLVNGTNEVVLDSTGVLTLPDGLTIDNSAIGYTTSNTITEETPGGTISSTTALENQITVDSTNSIIISNITTQTNNDGVVTTTDSTGSTLTINNTGAYVKRYVEPDGPNNSSYFQFSTTNSGAIIEGVNEEIAGNTYGRVTVTQGVVAINVAAEGVDKQWSFNSGGEFIAPEASSITGTNDLTIKSQAGGNNSGLFLNGNTLVGNAILYAHRNVMIRSDYDGDAKDWLFTKTGVLSVPSLFPKTFFAVVDAAHYTGEGSLTLEGDAWQFEVTFVAENDGSVSIGIINNTPWPSNPGYANDMTFEFTEADHGITGYTFILTLVDIQNPSQFMWTTNLTASQAPSLPSTIEKTDSIKLTSVSKSWTFNPDGTLRLPSGGDIVDSTGTSVLGGSGADLGLLKISGSTIGTKDDPDTGNWGSYGLYLDPGGESYGYIQIPSVPGQTAGGELVIANNNVGNGGIRLSVNGGSLTLTDAGLQVSSSHHIRQNNSWTRVTTPTVNFDQLGTIVWTSTVDYISSAKLIIQVEADEAQDTTGWHSQACEAIISCRGYANVYGGPGGDPQMIVYGVVHTSVNPLVTFTVRRNPTTLMVEVIGTLTATAASAAALRIHSVEMSTRD